jgi:hypothetical protein
MRRILAFATLALSPQWVAAQQIGIYFDTSGLSTRAVVRPMVSVRAYIVAGLDVSGMGIQGAEFSVNGYDSRWLNTVTPNPTANLMVGNPLSGGCQIAFPDCQTQRPLVLFTIDTIVPAPIPETTLWVVKHDAPSNPSFTCPRIVLCDIEVTHMCVRGEGAVLVPADVGTESATWTSVRALYH